MADNEKRLMRFENALQNNDPKHIATLMIAEQCLDADELFQRFKKLRKWYADELSRQWNARQWDGNCHIDGACTFTYNPFKQKIDWLMRYVNEYLPYFDEIPGMEFNCNFPDNPKCKIKISRDNIVVEKEVIKEIPVEKIVRKIVKREVEVPVIKEVIKEVEVPVEIKVPVEVINTLDKEKVALLSAILEQSK